MEKLRVLTWPNSTVSPVRPRPAEAGLFPKLRFRWAETRFGAVPRFRPAEAWAGGFVWGPAGEPPGTAGGGLGGRAPDQKKREFLRKKRRHRLLPLALLCPGPLRQAGEGGEGAPAPRGGNRRGGRGPPRQEAACFRTRGLPPPSSPAWPRPRPPPTGSILTRPPCASVQRKRGSSRNWGSAQRKRETKQKPGRTTLPLGGVRRDCLWAKTKPSYLF